MTTRPPSLAGHAHALAGVEMAHCCLGPEKTGEQVTLAAERRGWLLLRVFCAHTAPMVCCLVTPRWLVYCLAAAVSISRAPKGPAAVFGSQNNGWIAASQQRGDLCGDSNPSSLNLLAKFESESEYKHPRPRLTKSRASLNQNSAVSVSNLRVATESAEAELAKPGRLSEAADGDSRTRAGRVYAAAEAGDRDPREARPCRRPPPTILLPSPQYHTHILITLQDGKISRILATRFASQQNERRPARTPPGRTAPSRKTSAKQLQIHLQHGKQHDPSDGCQQSVHATNRHDLRRRSTPVRSPPPLSHCILHSTRTQTGLRPAKVDCCHSLAWLLFYGSRTRQPCTCPRMVRSLR
ncbi:hypothetical protein L1887_61079 [Cichorium endivia]|nr:hypothetical protein L1887_61079 [Cichorium endivia]